MVRERADVGDAVTEGQVRAAVALIRVPGPDAILIIERAVREGDPWSGQMGLPGGHAEPGDFDLVATAIRETEEEVGVSLPRSALVETLPDVAPRSVNPPPFLVRPFLFSISERPSLRLSSEVASATWVEWRALSDPANCQVIPIPIRGVERLVPAFVIDGRVIWGMTERVLAGLVAGG
ncbi:MAG TPA: CoA pyrophosphatase [Gemmatimonadales bacterium]|nr:CoA pyrophosphatase [Gemmatimonadales bacterium]